MAGGNIVIHRTDSETGTSFATNAAVCRQTPNSKPHTLNPTPYTLNPKP